MFDNSIKGIHGKKEDQFFSYDNNSTLRKKLSDIILNEIIPSIIYKDFNIFAKNLVFQKLNSSFTHQFKNQTI